MEQLELLKPWRKGANKYSYGYVLLDAPVARFATCGSMNNLATVRMRGEAAGYFFVVDEAHTRIVVVSMRAQ